MSSKSALYIVTGSSKGIGEALVKKLLEEPNNRVIGMARSQMELFHPNFKFIQIDLSNFQEILEHIDDIFPEESFAKVVLVNNAGWIGEIVHLGNMTPVGIYKTFVLNTIAPTVLMNAFIKKYGNQMKVERLIVNISSGAAKKAIDGWACYSASKAAINMLSEAVAIEASLDNTGIRVFSVAPGVVDTDMQSEIRKAEVESFSSLSKFVGLKENQLLSTPDHAAKKLLELIQNPENFEEVLQDVREF
ncbi:SDR family NAD(P)-dependent oxidoreductase [Cecembia rubra]|uniref:SDR family NAD(P)-dependent oxidoreductase n=1 Tax=Cecembia rubra TaxID=1485585 RepID=UPI002714957D|nr:SDR family NAD(P)-dependent oxidoreductase [Cecembia rubra]